MFRLLLVDDNPADVLLLRTLMKENIRRPHEFYVAADGFDALDFLHSRGPYHDAPKPNLILLDINMPGMNGLEVLAQVKADPELAVIPVIMLSSSNSRQEIRKAYAAHANCFVQKPTNLDRSLHIINAIEAFWMDVAVLPPCDEEISSPAARPGVR